MSDYRSPGVFIEAAPKKGNLNGSSMVIAGFAGVAQRGPIGVPVDVDSWNAYIDAFARGMTSPFIETSELAYAVYGFFQNGGKRCKVMRVAHLGDATPANNAAKAKMSGAGLPTIEAMDEGAWGNGLSVKIVSSIIGASNFDLTVYLNDVAVESHLNLSNTAEDRTYWIDYLNSRSAYVRGVDGDLAATVVESSPAAIDFTGGVEGLTALADTDYVGTSGLIKGFDAVDLDLLCIPGETSDTIVEGLLAYCESRQYTFALVDCTSSETVNSVGVKRKALDSKYGVLLFPWVKVTDPLSPNGRLHLCPPSGHVAGVYARIMQERGRWKAPAGTEAVLRGAVETAYTITTADLESLNPLGVVSILSKPGYGIVVWGARSLSNDVDMKYVSDVLLDMFINKSLYNETQPLVFEPSTTSTYIRAASLVQSFLDNLWRKGALAGETAEEAYFVKCDNENNTNETRAAGILVIEAGYARTTPAEFVVVRISHEIGR